MSNRLSNYINTNNSNSNSENSSPIKISYNKDFIDILKSFSNKEISYLKINRVVDNIVNRSLDNVLDKSIELTINDQSGINNIFTVESLPNNSNSYISFNIKALDENKNIIAEIENSKNVNKIRNGDSSFQIDKVSTAVSKIQNKINVNLEFDELKSFVEKLYDYNYETDKLNKIYVDIDEISKILTENKSIPVLSSSLNNKLKTSAIVKLISADDSNLDDAIISLDSTNLKAERIEKDLYFVEGIKADSEINITVLSKSGGTGSVKTILKRDFSNSIINISVSKDNI